MPYKPKAAPVMATPNVIPMADIMLVLLIIFMVITPMLTKGISVDMVKAANPQDMPDADKDNAVVLAITRDGNIFISVGSNTTPVTLDEITSHVRDMLADRSDKTIFIRSDARAKYGQVVKAVDEVRAAGVDNVGLLTEKLQQKKGPLRSGGSD